MKTKTFDCVEMKNEIQRKLQAEYEGLPLEERKVLMEKRILSNPLLGPLYLKSKAREKQKNMMVAEESPEYGGKGLEK
jgi:hypothetical protein